MDEGLTQWANNLWTDETANNLAATVSILKGKITVNKKEMKLEMKDEICCWMKG